MRERKARKPDKTSPLMTLMKRIFTDQKNDPVMQKAYLKALGT
jgi:hypothetical protein